MVDFNHFNFFKIFSSVLFQNLLLFLYYFIQDLTKNLSYVEWKIRESLGFVIPDSFLCLFCLQFSSVAQLCLTLCDPMDCNTPGFPVHRQLPELTQTHVHWVGDAIQPSHPLSFPSSPAFNLSQHQGLFKWVSSLHQVARAMEFQLQPYFYQYFFLPWFSHTMWRQSPIQYLGLMTVIYTFFQTEVSSITFLHSPCILNVYVMVRRSFVSSEEKFRY